MARESTRRSTKKKKVTKRAAAKKPEARTSKRVRAKRRARFSPEDRHKALELIMRGVRRAKVAREIGCSTETLRLWTRAAEREMGKPAVGDNAAAGDRLDSSAAPQPAAPATSTEDAVAETAESSAAQEDSAPTAPKNPGAGLSEVEVAAILEYKQRHPTMGPAQLRAQLKRFKGWRLSNRAIARVLKQNGYELEHRGGRPEEPKPPQSWEAPYRNALWQLDFTEVRIPEGRRALGVVLDDFSRFIVGYALLQSPTSEDVVAMLQEAIRLHGKPLAIYTDRAGPFLAWGKPEGLQHFLDAELIDHHLTPAYRPQGRGKVEAVLGTLKHELWEVEHFPCETDALAALKRFVDHYNHRRAHLSLEGLTPADRFFGRWERILALVEAQSRKRQGVEVLRAEAAVSSEFPPEHRSEILRLVRIEDEVELRLFGHRVRLGKIES